MGPAKLPTTLSPNGKHVWVLDKPTGNVRRSNVENVAQGKFFNDGFLRDGERRLPPEIPDGHVEHQFGKWETALTAASAAALRVAEGGGATEDERQAMATCLAVQMTRTPAFRKRLSEGTAGVLEDEANAYLAEKEPAFASKFRAKLSFSAKWAAALQYDFIWSSGQVPAIAMDLFFYIWRIGVNHTDIPLCTSDTPVSTCLHDTLREVVKEEETESEEDIVRRTIVGNRSLYGLELIFPVTSEVVLLMYHPVYFKHLWPLQGRRFALTREAVLHYNALQFLDSERQVFAPADIFDTVRDHASGYTEQIID